MSHTNSTPNYQLPQFVGTDKPAYLTDFNQAFSAIDTGIHAAKTAADTAGTDITEVEDKLNETNQNLTTLDTTVSTLQGTVTTVSQTANQANTKVDNLAEKFNFTTFINYSDRTKVSVSGATYDNINFTIAKNNDGSIFKMYGFIILTNISNATITITLTDTSILTEKPYNIKGIFTRYEWKQWNVAPSAETFNNEVTVNNNSMTFTLRGVPSGQLVGVRLDSFACLLFNQNFGD